MRKKTEKKKKYADKELKNLEEKSKLCDERHDQLLRLHAEFDNFKKRTAREYESLTKYANKRLISEMLPVIDNFKRAVDSADKVSNINDLKNGIKLVLKQFEDILKQNGLEEIGSDGTQFNPDKHEAVIQVETDEHPEDTVIEEVRTGYRLHGNVIRPSLVKVSKKISKNKTKNRKKKED
ncbi:MAG: nucleotide exchange factor GrpE [Candidatus Electryonea clarkiae]|nr:nucleotide exchange factor GrpE [Candidatus Electryonea clarkiae]